MQCKWTEIEQPNADGWRRVKCMRCGRTTAPTPHPHAQILATCRVLGYGDYLAALLSLFGLTRGRTEWIARLFGKQGCGCDGRQESVNKWGEKITAAALRLVNRLGLSHPPSTVAKSEENQVDQAADIAGGEE